MRAKAKRWVGVGAVVLMMGLGGCASTGSNSGQSQNNNRNNRSATPTGHLIEPGPAAELGYRISWTRDMELPRRQSISSITILDDLLITVERPENLITARSVRDGQLVWKVKIGSSLEHFYAPNRDGDRIFINSQTRLFTLKANSGEVTSVASLEVAVNTAPVYHPISQVAIFGGANGLVFAHSVNNNFARWRYKLPGRVNNPPVSTDRDVFVVDASGNYVMLEINTGTIQWRNRTLGGVVAAPAVQGNDILIASRDRKLYALNRTSGADTWQYLGAERPLTGAPIALGRLVVLPLPPDGGIVAIDALNGEERWRSDLNATPIVERDRDLMLHTDNRLYLLDLDEGETLLEAPTRPIQTVIPGPNGSLIMLSPGGRILRINRIDG